MIFLCILFLPVYLPCITLGQPSLITSSVPFKAAAPSNRSTTIFVKDFTFTGNSIFTDHQLFEIAAPYRDKHLSFEDLDELRQRLTDYYTENGYINSGAIIPDQDVAQGNVTYQIIEGRISEMVISTNGRLRLPYIRKRLTFAPETILNIHKLYEKFQLLHQNPLIKRVRLELLPGMALGESIVKAYIEEENPWGMEFLFNNHRSPSVGEEQGYLILSHGNVTGWGDRIELDFGLTRGMNDFAAEYAIPLTPHDTSLSLRFEKTDSEVIEDPFDAIDITGESYTWRLSLKHPFFRTAHSSFFMGVTAESRHSKTTLLGYPYNFSPGVDPRTGESHVTVIRLFQEWLSRTPSQVFAVQSTFSRGIDALDATINPSEPDSRFFSWLFQFQWARRIRALQEGQLIFKTNIQLSRDPLLPMEKFSVGGANTVRGYRENQFVRDNGLISSLELRLPLFHIPIPGAKGTGTNLKKNFQLAPFFDFGRSWNKTGTLPSAENRGTDAQNIYSTGAGILWTPMERLHTEIYFGWALKDIVQEGDALQDHGIHLAIRYQFL